MTRPKLIVVYILLLVYGLVYPTRENWEFPRKPNPIDLSLRQLEMASNNLNWKGRLITLLSVENQKDFTHTEFQVLNEKLLLSIGNNYSDAGVWIKNIPTLTEYNPSITPASYYFLSSILGRSGDQYHRNLIYFRNLDYNFMKIIGIQYIVTDSIIPEMGKPISQAFDDKFALYLYEIANPNLSGISVIRLEDVKNWADMVGELKFNANISKEAFTLGLEESPNYTVAKRSSLTLNSKGYRFQGISEGESLVVLPIEYSNCFGTSNESGEFEIIRLNGFMLGIRFREIVDVSFQYQYGAITNPFCRIMDYLQFKKGLK